MWTWKWGSEYNNKQWTTLKHSWEFLPSQKKSDIRPSTRLQYVKSYSALSIILNGVVARDRFTFTFNLTQGIQVYDSRGFLITFLPRLIHVMSSWIFRLFSPLICKYTGINVQVTINMPVTVAEQSKARTFFARSEARIVGSNPTQGHGCLIFVCMCVRFSVFVYR
jgi:hypothetical protein